MKKFGLIGHPIAHSLSPALFKAAYGGKYRYDLIEGEDFEASYLKFLEEYDGINVTAPFKELAYKKAEVCSDDCIYTGAANILTKTTDTDGRRCITAANSDCMGIIGALGSGIQKAEKLKDTALVVGCGGAGKAAAYTMLKEGYHVILVNRSIDKCLDFAFNLEKFNPQWQITVGRIEDIHTLFAEAGILIYTVPAPIDGLEDMIINNITTEQKVILEANYKDPAFSPESIDKIKEKNPKFIYIGGKEWLLHQAVDAFVTFTGEEPNIEEMRKVL